MRKEGEEASDTSSSEIDLPRLLNQIDATLSKKCDSSTRQKIVSKIKVYTSLWCYSLYSK